MTILQNSNYLQKYLGQICTVYYFKIKNINIYYIYTYIYCHEIKKLRFIFKCILRIWFNKTHTCKITILESRENINN